MRLKLAIFCLIACSNSALAQSGVSNQRDVYGNLVHNNGAYAPKGVNQGPVNNGPIRHTPPQPPTSNSSSGRGTIR